MAVLDSSRLTAHSPSTGMTASQILVQTQHKLLLLYLHTKIILTKSYILQSLDTQTGI